MNHPIRVYQGGATSHTDADPGSAYNNLDPSKFQQDTTQEISSIDQRPITAVTAHNDDSHYIFTSHANSVAEEEQTNRFVFNTRALEVDDLDETPNKYAKGTGSGARSTRKGSKERLPGSKRAGPRNFQPDQSEPIVASNRNAIHQQISGNNSLETKNQTA